MRKRTTTEEFINKSNLIHNNKYDYSKTFYTKNNNKVIITCPIHGDFEQRPYNHYQQGCNKCGVEKRSELRKRPLVEFIKQGNKIHNNKYDYSKVVYTNSNNKVIITCPIHGDFEQKPTSHLNGNGCVKCSGIKKTILQSSDKNEFIIKAKKIHGDNYDYSKVIYNKSYIKVTITCHEHGDFEQIPNSHLKGRGCPICGLKIKGGWTTTKWLDKSIKSKNFDSFKFYIVECFDNNERFIKIGRTFKTVKKRFEGKIPYKIISINEIIFSTHIEAFNFETLVKQILKDYRYTPTKKFGGMYECYDYKYKDIILSKISIVASQ